MSNPSLKEFTQAIPVCEQTSGLAAVLEIFCTSGCDAIVVLSEQQRPLGVINLRQVLPYLMPRTSGKGSVATTGEVDKPISQIEPPLIEPLTILPAHLNLSQFWAYLHSSSSPTRDWRLKQEDIPSLTSTHWALVDEAETFLGLLNSSQVLKSLASKFTATDRSPVQESLITQLNPLVQLLEQLPLPLSLQTATGEILAQNQTWQTQIGTLPDVDKSWSTTASQLDIAVESASIYHSSTDSENFETLTHTALQTSNTTELYSATASPCRAMLEEVEITHSALGSSATLSERHSSTTLSPLTIPQITPLRYKSSSRAATQHYCALATPHMAAVVSQRRVMLSGLSELKTQDDEVSPTPLPTSETLQNSQNRSFSCVRIPLPPSFVRPHEAWETLDASPELLLVLAQDITEQQQVAKELAAKNADLVQLNRLKDEFLACISHELKTPLTAVLGLSSLLKDQTLGALNERQTRYARLIYHSGRQLMAVVNDILDLTRMETGQLELTLEPVQIQSVCDRAYSQAQQRPSEKNQQEEEETFPQIKFTLEIEPGLELLVADELRLRQMLMHLLSNALKFTDSKDEIGLKVNRWEGWIAFTVWDKGIGIPAEKQHLIFQKFQQLEKPLTRRYEGTGLGLALTQRLARLHGGDISFISKPGVGSQFTLLLPPAPPHKSKDAEEISQSPSPPTPPTGVKFSNPQAPKRNRLVLLVETVPQYLEDLTQQLNNLAYRVVIARSGTEAIEKARSLQPCAVLLNPLLPQLSGWDVLTLLKSDAQTRHIPAIVTATQAEKKQAYHNKADGFLSLPVQEQALLQSLTSLGDRSLAPTKRNLTILHLSPELDDAPADSSVLSSELTAVLNNQNSELSYRVLEADDLDQAELLVRVWHPDVVLLDSSRVADPFAYLEQFSSYLDLTALPLVTLDRQTTAAANQVIGLTVYPCLASDNPCRITALMQVLQVASGMSRQPSILVMDIGQDRNDSDHRFKTVGDNSEHSPRQNSHHATGSTSDASWFQALIQYLETAGFSSIVSCAWTDVHRQLEDQSVDLLLLRLRDTSNPEALLQGLSSLSELPTRPPILVLDHRLEDEVKNCKGQLTSELESLLLNVATQVLSNSHSMSQLLHQINQTLTEN